MKLTDIISLVFIILIPIVFGWLSKQLTWKYLLKQYAISAVMVSLYLLLTRYFQVF